MNNEEIKVMLTDIAKELFKEGGKLSAFILIGEYITKLGNVKENTVGQDDVNQYTANFIITSPMVNEIVTLAVRYSKNVSGSLALLKTAEKIILDNSKTIQET